jgi:hypothetical protein
LPTYIFYSKRELTLKQMLLRRILHFIVLELTLTVFGYATGIITNTNMAFTLAFFVFLVYLFTNVIKWIIDRNITVEINKGLKRIQS